MTERGFGHSKRQPPHDFTLRDHRRREDDWRFASASWNSGSARPEPRCTLANSSEDGRKYNVHVNGAYVDKNLSNFCQLGAIATNESSTSSKFRWSSLLEENSKIPDSKPSVVGGFGGEICGFNAYNYYQRIDFSNSDSVKASPPINNKKVKDSPMTYSNVFGDTRTHGDHQCFKSSLGKNQVGPEKINETTRRWEHPHKNNFRLGAVYEQGREHGQTLLRAEVGSRYTLPVSEEKAFVGDLHNGDTGDCDHFPLTSENVLNERFGRNEHDQTSYYDSTEFSEATSKELSEMRVKELANHKHAWVEDDMHEDTRCPQVRRNKFLDDIHYRTVASIGEINEAEDFMRPSIVNQNLDGVDGVEVSFMDAIRKHASREQQISLKEHLKPQCLDATRSSYKHEDYDRGFSSGKTHFDYGAATYQNIDMLHPRAANAYERDGYSVSPAKVMLLHHDEYLCEQMCDPSQMCRTEELTIHNSHGAVDKGKGTVYGISWASLNARDSEESGWTDDVLYNDYALNHADNFVVSPRYSAHKHQILAVKRTRDRLGPAIPISKSSGSDHTSVHKRLGSTALTPCETKSSLSPLKDIRKRLRSARSVPNGKAPVAAHRSIFERMGPVGIAPHRNSYAIKSKKNNSSGRRSKDSDHSAHAQSLHQPKVEETHSHNEPAEDSEEFKGRVNKAFLKFVKLLNENPANRKKYIDEKGSGPLKCNICGSNSEDYVDILSLVSHAASSLKGGTRVEHLGFHKAICLFLGWNAATVADGRWVKQILPKAEANALREDLIIWPPVVMVHNISITHNDPVERTIVSVEELEEFLRDKGFGSGMIKVCRGRPANQSILAVTFNATFTGLQEAERLDKYFADKKHGRSDLERSNGLENNEDILLSSAEKRESVLYCYLANAEDLYKLDFGSKRRSAVKSKKDIQVYDSL